MGFELLTEKDRNHLYFYNEWYVLFYVWNVLLIQVTVKGVGGRVKESGAVADWSEV